jgi:hypothetical protein
MSDDAAGAATDTDHELLRQLEAQVRRAPIVLLNDGRASSQIVRRAICPTRPPPRHPHHRPHRRAQ